MTRHIRQILPVLLFLLSLPASAHWESKGPYGGSVKCLTVIDTFVYVGTPAGGLYRSSSRSLSSWKALNSVMSTGKINAIAALGTTLVIGSADQGIFISTDKGVTWVQKNSGLTNTNVLSLTVSGTTLYAGTNGNGIFKSIDSGDTWTAVNSGLSNLTINTLASANTVLVAGTNGGGIFYSINEGTNWTSGNTGLTNLNITSLSYSGNTVLASTKGGGIFSASTFTFSWSSVNTGLTNMNVKQVLLSGSTAYAATGSGVFTSPASSITWTIAHTGFAADTATALALFENKLVAGTAQSGLYTSDASPIIWSEKNNGFNNLKTYALITSGNMIIVATEKGVYVSRNLPENYILCNQGLEDSLNVTCLAFFNKKLFAGTKSGMYQSADTGRTWQSSGLQTYITSMLVNNNRLYATANNHASVYMTPLSTTDWTTLNGGFQSNTQILTLIAHGDDLYAGTNSEGVYVFKSGAEYWTYFNSGMNNQHVSSMAIISNKILGATPNNGVFSSNISSAAWSLSNNGLPDVRLTAMASFGQYVLVGYKGGVYASSDNGASWQSLTTLLNIPPYTTVTNIAFSNDRIFITTPNNSVYSNAKDELPGWTTSIFDPHPSTNHALRVIPNPNHGTFKIDYSTLNVQVSELSIYNYSGQLMDSFVKGEENITVNYPPGLYIVRLRTVTNEVMMQKMIVE